MKKNKNLRIIVGIILSLVLLTWLIPAGTIDAAGLALDQLNPVGIMGLLSYPLTEGVQYFLIYGIFILAIGGLYGVMNKTGAYKNLLDGIVKAVKGKEIWLVASIAVLMAALSSVTGATVPLLVFVPFLVSVILLMGYDKLVAILATIGALLVGSIGAIYGYSNAVFFKHTLQIENVGAGWPYTLALFVGGLILLVGYIVWYEKNKKPLKKAELDKEDALFTGGRKTKTKVWPLVVVLKLTFLITILATVSWMVVFQVEAFQNAYEWFQEFTIFDFAILNFIIGRVFVFGEWQIGDITALVLIATGVIALVYRMKLADITEGFVDGVKKMAETALIVWLVYTVLIITVYHPFYLTIMKWIVDLSSTFNPALFTLLATIGSFLHVDSLYFGNTTLPLIPTLYEGVNTTHLAIMAQSVFSYVMLLVPTSVLLIFGLTYLDVPYKLWIKFIWKFALALFVLIAIIVSIMTSTFSMLILAVVLIVITCGICKFVCKK